MELPLKYPFTPPMSPSPKSRKQKIDSQESPPLLPESMLEKERLIKKSEPPNDKKYI